MASVRFQRSPGASFSGPNAEQLANRALHAASGDGLVEVEVEVDESVIQARIRRNRGVRQGVAAALMEQFATRASPSRAKVRCRKQVEGLLGPGLHVPFTSELARAYRSPLVECSCGRLVPWRRARFAGEVVHVLAMHAPETSPGRACPHMVEVYEDLDPVLPWIVSGPSKPTELSKTDFWQQVALVPTHLGGPVSISSKGKVA